MSSNINEMNSMYILHPVVRKLQTYDKRNATDYGKTLQNFLECDRSLKRTADVLYLHKNTVGYRIERIKEMCGITLTDMQEVVHILISYRLLEEANRYEQGHERALLNSPVKSDCRGREG